MSFPAYLHNRKTENLLKRFADELSGYRSRLSLSSKATEIGLLLLNKHRVSDSTNYQFTPITEVSPATERLRRLEKLIPADGFRNPEMFSLLVYFFGEEKAPLVAHAWNRAPFQIYQDGFARRSFRSPGNPARCFRKRLNMLVNAIPQTCRWDMMEGKGEFYDLSLSDQIRYGHFFTPHHLYPLWAAAIDLGNDQIFRQMEDIVFNRDDVGKVSRELIKALLMSERREAWELVEKLLLAAQRQEGLRQTILEVADETTVGALKHLIRVIISNKLTRFSSVVRAVDVWAGLGWESEREKAINKFLENGLEFLDDPTRIAAGVESDDNLEIYTALWAQGVIEIERCAPLLDALFASKNPEKRALSLKFASETRLIGLQLALYERALDDDDHLVLAWALAGLLWLVANGVVLRQHEDAHSQLFDKLRRIVEKNDKTEKTFNGRIFSWTRISFKRNQALFVMMELIGRNQSRLDIVLPYFDEMTVELREKLTRQLLPEFVPYSQMKSSNATPTRFQREFAFRLLSDRGAFMVDTAVKALASARFSADEMTVLQGLLKRKAAGFRGQIIKLLLNQPDDKLIAATTELIATGDGEQRLAALDILLQLKKSQRLESRVGKLAAEYGARKSVSPKEEILLAELIESAGRDLSEANGFGFFDVSKCAPRPSGLKKNPDNIFERRRAGRDGGLWSRIVGLVKTDYGFSVPFKEVKAELEELARLFSEHKNFEYEVENWDGARETILLANDFRHPKMPKDLKFEAAEYGAYPLAEVWENWFAASGLDAGDLEIISLAAKPMPEKNDVVPPLADLMPAQFRRKPNWQKPNQLIGIVEALKTIHPFAERNEFLIGACARLFGSLDTSVLKMRPRHNYWVYGHHGDGWQHEGVYNALFSEIKPLELDVAQTREFWWLAHWRQFSGRPENIAFSAPPLAAFCRAFEAGEIGEDELARGILHKDNIRELSMRKVYPNRIDYFERFSFMRPLFERIRDHLLDAELRRGDSPTPVTGLATSLQTIFGVRRFVEILKGLGKTPLERGYVFYSGGSNDTTKQSSFSCLLKRCFPLESDTQEDFDELVKKAKISEKTLIEAAVYAPQWHRFVSRFLDWKGLDSAVWWMHAHTKISGYREQNSEAESEIARFSAVDLEDFKDGAVDKEWFLDAHKQIGRERWEIVYDAAKFISEGNGHRRARIYADVILGNIKIREIAERVKTKRDQDYLRVYGLAPLSRANPSKDVLARYEYLQHFKKESRQFGSMKQTSESLAVRVAMENLARNAGYPDPVRLTWAMETQQVQRILSSETEMTEGDVTVRLEIDADGKAELVVTKGEKTLKAIPAALKKDKRILELGDHRKILREQFRRSRASLEEAMVRGDGFSPDEIATLFGHPVISKHLEKLVFVAGQKHGFFRNGKLVSAKNAEFPLAADDRIRLAHCHDLFQTGEWSEYQRYCFDRELRQPFKQIFRELYLPTDDEKREKSVSRRYAGHQIQPAKTLALLKSRGWKVDHEEGLQKVFHRERFVAVMYAMADWFSPADVESPTLETVQFVDLKTYKNVDFETIEPRIFSEVMRDVDLVVSVAHVGGVDPEASLSTIEMRSVLLAETLRLFKLDNVAVSGNHARIKGTMGEYSVHLGSAVVHKMPGTYLSILPVHSQKRGRIFLPFADDDPRSAELISKVLLLARDDKIQDPTILRQLV